METFTRRLKYYGIGFGIGLLFVFFFFKNRGCSWLPGNRVKNSFLERLIVVSEDDALWLKKKGISEKEVLEALNDGEVDFNESLKKGNPKVYKIDKSFEGKGMVHFFFTLPENSFVSELVVTKSKASSVINSLEGKGQVIHFPKDNDMVYIDSSKVVTCMQDKLGYTDTRLALKDMKKGLTIDFSNTNFKLKPRPEHTLVWKNKQQKEIVAKANWYKNKINISQLKTKDSLGCD